jgi:AmiR/NasT family two-component response regulator
MNAPRTLLLVDDDRLILATTAASLRAAGYRVLEADSVDAALAQLAHATPDLALLDIRMGPVGGLDLARELQRQGRVPFMFLSAYNDLATVEQATEAGAVGFVVKPVDAAQLVPAVEAGIARAVDLARLRSTGRQLEQALDQQRAVSVAIGVLMERHRMTHNEAQALLRDHARAARRRMADVAERVVDAAEQLALSGLRGES